MIDQPTKDMMVSCAECGFQDFMLQEHLMDAHGLTVDAYCDAHPSASVISDAMVKAWEATRPAPKRIGPPNKADLTVSFAGMPFPVHADVPASACLPMPEAYRVPTIGKLVKDVQHFGVSMRRSRSIYIWGLPGTGKDAVVHAWSWMTRTPGAIFQVTPSTDIQSWFFSRGFDEKGTTWVEGEFLKAVRDGYLLPDGTRIPMVILVSDFDRADKSQAEYLRLICDSIAGRVMGPGGVTYPVLAGTRIVATANSSGSGDVRGRCISSNPIDASILDRFERTYEFHYMDWADEEPVVREKFPLIAARAGNILPAIGQITSLLRAAVERNELYCEFSHRALCKILGHAEDIIHCSDSKKVPNNVMRKAIRAWVDGLPDPDTRTAARNIIDPHLPGGSGDEGDTSHISTGKDSLAPNFS